MDLRAPLDGGNFVTAPYERIIHCQLCQMYIASQSMELGSESRFTSLVLFHRYAQRFFALVMQQQQRRHQGRPHQSGREEAQELELIRDHLEPVAAACLFLGCKVEEEPRRIRDVMNLSSLLNVSSAWDEKTIITKDPTTIGHSCLDTQKNKRPKKLHTVRSNSRAPIITFTEAPHPPPLDEKYWAAKEQMVSTEQHVLRMMSFDSTVCHPHRCVLLMMETLRFGTGINKAKNRNNDKNETAWLLSSEQSEDIILRSFNMLNEVSLDPRGVALRYPVMVLSCAVISLAADHCSEERQNDDTKDDEKKADLLPAHWWRALDVSTSDVLIAKKTLQQAFLDKKEE